MKSQIIAALLFASCSLSFAGDTDGPGFLYTGSLKTNVPNISPVRQELANGPYDFEFRMFDSTGGTNLTNQIGVTVTKTNVTCSNGVFRVRLDFGYVRYGKAGFLEIAVRPTFSILPQAFEKLWPLQPIPTVPLADWSKRGGNQTWFLAGALSPRIGRTGSDSGGIDLYVFGPDYGTANGRTNWTSFVPSANHKQVDSIRFRIISYTDVPLSGQAGYTPVIWNLRPTVHRFDTGSLDRSLVTVPVNLSSNLIGQWLTLPMTNGPTTIIAPGEVLTLTVFAESGGVSPQGYPTRLTIWAEATVRDPD